jgi:hypothetical protein
MVNQDNVHVERTTERSFEPHLNHTLNTTRYSTWKSSLTVTTASIERCPLYINELSSSCRPWYDDESQ